MMKRPSVDIGGVRVAKPPIGPSKLAEKVLYTRAVPSSALPPCEIDECGPSVTIVEGPSTAFVKEAAAA